MRDAAVESLLGAPRGGGEMVGSSCGLARPRSPSERNEGHAPLRVAEITAAMISVAEVQIMQRQGFLHWQSPLEDLPEAVGALVVSGIRFAQVHTKGDGACGIHAVFGVPHIARDGSREIFCEAGRSRASEAIRTHVADTRGGRYYDRVLETLWRDVCFPRAQRVLRIHGHANEAQASENGMVWDALSGVARDSICGHVASAIIDRREEDAQRQAFDSLVRAAFDVRFEPFIRRLAFTWGLLPDAGNDFMHWTSEHCARYRDRHIEVPDLLEDAFFALEDGARIVKSTKRVRYPDAGERPPAHKYAALFDARPCFDSLRQAKRTKY
jgi:hypothetical protein